MDPVGDDVREELRRLGGESGPGAETTDAWTAAVGEEIARNAWPARTQADGTLVVHVRDAVWGFELTQRATEIAARLPSSSRLRFVPGPLPDEAPSEVQPAAPQASPEQEREAEAMAAGIIDPELRESVAKVIKSALARAPDDRPI
ncbi:MAG TPA: DciA family protein [Gaiellaceae bacterium]|nr:DciA family protein [Gaiellaceae bacterium]